MTIAAVCLCLTCSALAGERVVVLAPAAADVLFRLGAANDVVGVTNNVTEFPEAVKVGTHLNPGIEKTASLRPTLIVAGARFDPELAHRMGAKYFLYEPKTLDDILKDIRRLAKAIGREAGGEELAAVLERIAAEVRLPKNPPSVLYETRSAPLAVAGGGSITKDLLERAGMKYARPRGAGAISAEWLLADPPDFYLCQVGPMNKNPRPPQEREGWSGFASCVWMVEEIAFTRPNTRLFQTLRELNEILNGEAVCETGRKRYAEQ